MQKLNSEDDGSALNINELGAGYFIIAVVKPSVDDSGLLERFAYEISNGVMAGLATTADHAA